MLYSFTSFRDIFHLRAHGLCWYQKQCFHQSSYLCSVCKLTLVFWVWNLEVLQQNCTSRQNSSLTQYLLHPSFLHKETDGYISMWMIDTSLIQYSCSSSCVLSIFLNWLLAVQILFTLSAIHLIKWFLYDAFHSLQPLDITGTCSMHLGRYGSSKTLVSYTNALHLSIQSLDSLKDDKVWLSVWTCLSTFSCIFVCRCFLSFFF